jgi:hypothetical protein
MDEHIKRLKDLVNELERLAQSSQPYAYDEALNHLGMIECEARILRPIVVANHKGKR